jgi:hypothetical protein
MTVKTKTQKIEKLERRIDDIVNHIHDQNHRLHTLRFELRWTVKELDNVINTVTTE